MKKRLRVLLSIVVVCSVFSLIAQGFAAEAEVLCGGISWFQFLDLEVTYGNVDGYTFTYFKTYSCDTNGDGEVGPGSDPSHSWRAWITGDNFELEWCSLLAFEFPIIDPGTTDLVRYFVQPPGAEGEAEEFFLVNFRSTHLDVDKTYDFTVWTAAECWSSSCVWHKLDHTLTVNPLPISGFSYELDTDSQATFTFEWTHDDTAPIEIASYSVYVGDGVQLKADNFEQGTLVQDQIGTTETSCIYTPIVAQSGLFVTVFGHDPTGKIIARTEPTPLPEVNPVSSDRLSWDELRALYR